MNEVCISGWTILAGLGSLPDLFDEYVANAAFVDLIDLDYLDQEGACFYAISNSLNKLNWPEIVIAARFSPYGFGFNPGILIAPETSTLFLGFGTRLMAYDLASPKRIWSEFTEFGFLRWRQHNDVVVMSGELEIAAWSTKGEKLWSKYVEPPWSYEIADNDVFLDVMGRESQFNIYTGS